MKKIWPWLLLLLLLIIICVWFKIDTFTTTKIPPNKPTHISTSNNPTIGYKIIQTEEAYTLHGKFTNYTQIETLKKSAKVAESTLLPLKINIDSNLQDTHAIGLTNEVLPIVINHYHDARISYANNELNITGTTSNKQAQEEIKSILNKSTIKSTDYSRLLEKEPITFKIQKDITHTIITGIFSSKEQLKRLEENIDNADTTSARIQAHAIDSGVLPLVQSIVPIFSKQYTKGSIEYDGKKLSVQGDAKSQTAIDHINTLLAKGTIPSSNQSKVDARILEEEKRRQEALKQQALQEQLPTEKETKDIDLEEKQITDAKQKKAEEKSEKERLAETQKRLAEQKAIEEREKQAQEAREKERLALAQKRLAEQTKLENEKKRLKLEISNILQKEKIEFNSGKSTLSTQGLKTVTMLADILKKYQTINIEIAGHTDSDGSETFNKTLSQSRVDTVKSKLVAQGIHAQRIKAIGYGESKPLVPNTSKQNKQINRRVEFNIQGE